MFIAIPHTHLMYMVSMYLPCHQYPNVPAPIHHYTGECLYMEKRLRLNQQSSAEVVAALPTQCTECAVVWIGTTSLLSCDL